MAAQKELIHQR